MRQVKNPRPSRQFKRVRWDELKHAWLYSEIERAVADRRPSEARDEVELRELTKRLPEMQAAEHRKYTSLVVAEMKRELRICRDEYHKYLERINAESRTAKWKVALEFEVAPRASRRLSQEATAYLRDAHVDETVFDFLFLSGGLPIIEPASNAHELSLFCRRRSMEDVIPADSFQHLRERNFEIPDGGPFRSPLVRSAESLDLYNRNQMWISQLCRLWDEVLDEIIHQHFEIDLEERANAIYAVESLSLFRRRAGLMCLEARERHGSIRRGVWVKIPDSVWVKIGERIDTFRIPLKENLEPAGTAALSALARQGIQIKKWADALAYKRGPDDPVKEQIAPDKNAPVRYTNTISRYAKRAIYRASDAYRAALDSVYERRRIHLP